MKKVVGACCAMLALAGCFFAPSVAAAKKPVWVIERRVDQFTDITSCRVQPRAVTINRLIYPYAMQFYPYVETRGGEVRVGMFSGGGIAVPAGRVQLRIDDNDAWTIETTETPVDSEVVSAAAMAGQMKSSMGTNLTPEMSATFDQSANASAQTINQAMSPYTATTGDRAARLIAEMRGGRSMIYRRLAANAAGSTTGTIALGGDFNAALAACGL